MARFGRNQLMIIAICALGGLALVGINMERASVSLHDGMAWATSAKLQNAEESLTAIRADLAGAIQEKQDLERKVLDLQQQLKIASASTSDGITTSPPISTSFGKTGESERTERTDDQGAQEDQVEVWGNVHDNPGFPEAMRRLTERVGRVYCAVPSSYTEAKMDQWRSILQTWGARCDVIKFFVDPNVDENGQPMTIPTR
jgi:hypothetical protein